MCFLNKKIKTGTIEYTHIHTHVLLYIYAHNKLLDLCIVYTESYTISSRTVSRFNAKEWGSYIILNYSKMYNIIPILERRI